MEESERLRAYVRGELDEADTVDLRTALDAQPELRRRLADVALEPEDELGEPGGAGREHTLRIGRDGEVMARPRRRGIELLGKIGSGGMAVVHSGRQLVLDRSVAIKKLRPSRRDPAGIAMLLKEARLTGRLEHPNIVPVHDIVVDRGGAPQVVLKLIEGQTWSELMADGPRVHALFGADDLLEWNVEVLMSVCRALSFAHSRGVLHRDVKPSNVMVGRFGEVYLLDWGIAIEVGESAPRVEDEVVTGVAGTIGYMAPEQLRGEGALLGEWTDTYLVAATLYHALAGEPPHARKGYEARCADLRDGVGPPPLPATVPDELASVVAAAMRVDPAERTGRPEDLRRALAAFLEHRAANRLVARAAEARVEALDAAARGAEADAERACTAAEIAYHAALEEWPGCDEARRGLAGVATLRIERALARGEPSAAARILETCADAPEDLRARVAEAVEEAAREAARVDAIVADSDRRVGHRTRGVLGGVFGALWVGGWIAIAVGRPQTVWPLVALTSAFLATGAAAVFGGRRQLLGTRSNRMTVAFLALTLVVTIVWCLGGAAMGLSVQQIEVVLLLIWALGTGTISAGVDLRGAPLVVGYFVAFVVAALEPAWTPHAVVGSTVLLVVNNSVLNYVLARRGWNEA